MSSPKKQKKTVVLDQEKIDRLVISQSEDDSAWEAPIRIKRSKPVSLSIPGELATRAAFLAKLHRAKRAIQAGCHGVVASGREASKIRALSKDLIIVTPGIRPAWCVKGDQTRVMTPARALELGADYLVIGRPITAAKDPREAAQRVIEEISRF